MSKIGLFFGPLKGSVNRVADLIRDKIGEDKVEMVHVRNATPGDFGRFDRIIFGISTVGSETWNASINKTDWGIFLPEISKGDFAGKTVAIFGLGNHVTYASSFVDFMGLLARELMKTEARIVGQVPTDGYEFEESAAIFNGQFIGLPLDEDFEPELTPERVDNWLEMLQKDFNF
jgi:flavodoxin I